MPDYTNYNSMAMPQWVGTVLVPRTGMLQRIASNGTVRLRAMQSVIKRDPTVFHGVLTLAQRNALVDFHVHTWNASFFFTATEDSVQRTVCWAPKPYDIKPNAQGNYEATCYLVEI